MRTNLTREEIIAKSAVTRGGLAGVGVRERERLGGQAKANAAQREGVHFAPAHQWMRRTKDRAYNRPTQRSFTATHPCVNDTFAQALFADASALCALLFRPPRMLRTHARTHVPVDINCGVVKLWGTGHAATWLEFSLSLIHI